MPSLPKLDQTHQECQEMEEFTAAFLRQVTEGYLQSRNNEGRGTFLKWAWQPFSCIQANRSIEKGLVAKQIFHLTLSGVCVTHFIKLWTQFGRKVNPQNWTWETYLQHRSLYNVLQTQQEGIKTGATVCGTYCSRYLYKSYSYLYLQTFTFLSCTCRGFQEEAAQTDIVWAGCRYNLHRGSARK